MTHATGAPAFLIKEHASGIFTVKPSNANAENTIGFVNQAVLFVEQLEILVQRDDVKAIMFSSLFPYAQMHYDQLFVERERDPDFREKLNYLLVKVDQIRKQPKPLIAYLKYDTVGLNLSVCLWAHYVVLLRDCCLQFPETKFGLLPGMGAIQYTLSRMSMVDAYDFLTQGKAISAKEAQSKGLITHVINGDEDPFTLAERLIDDQKSSLKQQSYSKESIASFDSLIENSIRKTKGLIPGFNALIKIMESIVKPSKFTPIQVETQAYSSVIESKNAEAMVRTEYYHMIESRPAGFLPVALDSVGIIGAGMMGAGIAYEAAKAGAQVFLKDKTLALAEKGKYYSEQVCLKLIDQGKMRLEHMDSILSNIHPVINFSTTQSLDLIIEAVFEDLALKKQVIQRDSVRLAKNGFFATNTTSLSINKLATAVDRPENFIGMHFFSPVERMNLVEVIRGKDTATEIVERAVAFAYHMKKTPIVVNDGPGFFTSRVFFNYLLEAITMILEGIPAFTVESEAKSAGFATSPLSVLDEISIPLMLHVYDQYPSLSNSQLRAYTYLERMVKEGRTGRKSNRGFYNYFDGKREIWIDPTLANSSVVLQLESISKRLLHIMALDSFRCLDEGILQSPRDGDIGCILGIGYPRHIGGVFSYIDQVGLKQFVSDCKFFRNKGEQWEVPVSLSKLVKRNFKFYSGMKSNWK